MKIYTKVLVIFLIVVSALAAPSSDSIDNKDKKIIVSEKIENVEKRVENKNEPVVVSSNSDVSKVEKVVEKILEKDEFPSLTDASSSEEEKVPVVVVEDEKTDEEKVVNAKDEEKEKEITMRENSAICRAGTGATEEEVAALNANPEKDTSQAAKCYIKCMTEVYGVVNKDQIVQKDVVRKHKPSTIATKDFETAVENCAELKTDDPCDSAYLRYSCYFRTTGSAPRIHY